ncbi:hypothetical protein E2C01_020129 [Portunus trituberculatus]|uniref:Secreted protein n=1 Tax=Portunus trituberculatus TaxID=210409 RepID=A0A5B7E0W9_PORTR|nr:hypothetical protein [Portunus trituberculatus]
MVVVVVLVVVVVVVVGVDHTIATSSSFFSVDLLCPAWNGVEGEKVTGKESQSYSGGMRSAIFSANKRAGAPGETTHASPHHLAHYH